ncbi:MAG: hypothetical protein RBT58_04225 [Pseudomonadaceae bacterium]|nr:hypothetical protein [Pseudomonadaceae bacterium]
MLEVQGKPGPSRRVRYAASSACCGLGEQTLAEPGWSALIS